MTEQQANTVAEASRPVLRAYLFVPAVILFLTGLAVTFTQVLHDDQTFNAWLVAAFGVIFGISLWLAPTLGGVRTRQSMIVAGFSILLGIAAPFATSAALLGLLLLVWASVLTIAEIWRWVVSRERDALTIGIFAALLAAVLAFGARELPAVMGFFAAYCIIIGVYVGIAALDRAAAAHESEASFA